MILICRHWMAFLFLHHCSQDRRYTCLTGLNQISSISISSLEYWNIKAQARIQMRRNYSPQEWILMSIAKPVNSIQPQRNDQLTMTFQSKSACCVCSNSFKVKLFRLSPLEWSFQYFHHREPVCWISFKRSSLSISWCWFRMCANKSMMLANDLIRSWLQKIQIKLSLCAMAPADELVVSSALLMLMDGNSPGISNSNVG